MHQHQFGRFATSQLTFLPYAPAAIKKPSSHNRTKATSLYHLLRHTDICVPDNGGKPAKPTEKALFSLRLQRDVRKTDYLHRTHTISGSLLRLSISYCLFQRLCDSVFSIIPQAKQRVKGLPIFYRLSSYSVCAGSSAVRSAFFSSAASAS